MKMYIGLGSNLGDREENIRRAVDLMDKALGTVHTGLSSMFENPACGFDGPDFLNAVAEYELEADSDALDILKQCKDVERKLGRGEHSIFDENGKRMYSSRTIDIDILLLGDRHIDMPQLKVPHPHMMHRDFVMVPLGELCDVGDLCFTESRNEK